MIFHEDPEDIESSVEVADIGDPHRGGSELMQGTYNCNLRDFSRGWLLLTLEADDWLFKEPDQNSELTKTAHATHATHASHVHACTCVSNLI